MRSPWRSIGLFGMFALCGCTYLKNRTNDLLDPFRFDVGFTPGLHVEARATDFAALGLGVKGGTVVGVHGRFVVRHGTVSLGLGPVMLGDTLHPESDALLGGESSYSRDHDLVPGQMFFVPLLGTEHAPDWSLARRGLHVADIGVSAAAVVGAGVGFSPGEFLDLLLGFVGIDIAGDDVFGGETTADAASTSGTPERANPRSER